QPAHPPRRARGCPPALRVPDRGRARRVPPAHPRVRRRRPHRPVAAVGQGRGGARPGDRHPGRDPADPGARHRQEDGRAPAAGAQGPDRRAPRRHRGRRGRAARRLAGRHRPCARRARLFRARGRRREPQAPGGHRRLRRDPAGAQVAGQGMIEHDRLIAPSPASPSEEVVERALRPRKLADYIGQPRIREQLDIFMSAARHRSEPLDHLLLFGPPGLGKTTLAHIVAAEMGVNLRQTSGPVLEKPGDLAAILTSLERNDVLFIDEIHRLSPVVEEILYPALEDYQIDIMIGEGPAARSIKLEVAPFTLVGATTRAGMITNPLGDRFGIVAGLEFYNEEDLARIVTRSASLLEAEISPEGAREIARRSRGTPRIANRLLRRVRDYAQVRTSGRIDDAVADAALRMLDVDSAGLDLMDRALLTAILEKFG